MSETATACYACSDGYVACSLCKGKGFLHGADGDCRNCQGKKRLPCAACKPPADPHAAAAKLQTQAQAVAGALCDLLSYTGPDVEGEITIALARQAPGCEWPDLAARRVCNKLRERGWLRIDDAPEARALARQALTPGPS